MKVAGLQKPTQHSKSIWQIALGALHAAGRHKPESHAPSQQSFDSLHEATGRIKDPAEKQRAREALATGFFPEWSGQLERQITGPFLGGAALSVADLKLFVALTPLLAGKIDHVPAETFKPFPKLVALVESVKTSPKVVEWYARSAKTS